MKTILPVRLLVLLFIAALMGSNTFAQDASSSEETTPPILPIPQSWTWERGQMEVDDVNHIILGSESTEGDRFAARQLQTALSDYYDLDVPIRTEQEAPDAENAIVVGAPEASGLVSEHVTAADLPDGDLAGEGYILEVGDDGAVVAGQAEVGRFYGMMSLAQLLEAGSGEPVRAVRITDHPSMKFRGVSDDISRGQVSTLPNFKKIVRFMGRHKMNFYTPYTEDVLELESYLSIGENRGALSKEEVRELQDYADKWHVDIVPTFQTLGHYENILNMDQFVKYAEYPGSATLNTQDPKTYEFLETMLDEVTSLFDSEYIHIGVDEAWDIGKGASAEAVEESSVPAVLAEHFQKIYEMLDERGKKVIAYGDMPLRHPEGPPSDVQATFEGIPDELIFLDWQYAATDDFPSAEMFAQSGHPWIMGPAVQNWRRVYPNQTAAWTNIYYATLAGYRNGALGSIAHSWGDMGGPNFRELAYREYAYTAESGWNPTGAEKRTIDDRFNQLFYGSDPAGLDAVNALMTRLSHDVYFGDVWEHPFRTVQEYPQPGPRPFPGKAVPVVASFRELPVQVKALDIQESAQAAIQVIDNLQPELPQNSEHLDYHRWTARLSKWFGKRMEYVSWLFHIRREFEPQERLSYQEEAVRRGRRLRGQIDDLYADFEDLWLRTNRPANLERLETLFNHQRAYLGQIIDALQNNEWSVPTDAPSDFITASGVSGAETESSVYLRNTFQIDPNRSVKKATLQLVGDTYAEAWINGEQIGRVMGQGTLSLWVKQQRVKRWNVTDQLASGANVLAAQATSYGRDVPGAANLYLEIRYDDGAVRRVLSDGSWQATGQEPPSGWTTTGFDAEGWTGAQTEDRQTVSVPLFEYGMSSRTE